MLEVHVLASGSDGNCTIIECDGEAVMIDAGVSCKRIQELMDVAGVDREVVKALLITHEHSDHISGAGAVARRFDIPVMTNIATYEASHLGNVRFQPVDCTSSFDVGGMRVTSLPTSHDAVDPCCYFTETDCGRVLLATDTGRLNFQIEHAMARADLAIIESNYDPEMLANGPYPYYLKQRIKGDRGHLSNFDCAEAIRRNTSGGTQLFLAHLSKKNNVPDLARQTVSDVTGIDRRKIDCMEFPGDVRNITVRV